MRDPELVARAPHAASRLKPARERWRALQGLGETSAQPVVGYVGYTLKEPWGQPRAVIRFSAGEAERLAELLEGGSAATTGPRARAPGSRGSISLVSRSSGSRSSGSRSRRRSNMTSWPLRASYRVPMSLTASYQEAVTN